ncbi:hypothetical protein [uncultured Bilophila sp.]|nr:hypothetical protein [uncultured Bilophila sp.]
MRFSTYEAGTVAGGFPLRAESESLPAPLLVRFLPFTSPQLSCPMPFACR